MHELKLGNGISKRNKFFLESKLTYSITNGNEGNAFEVVAELGEIKVRGDLDYEKGNRVNF